jgi:hypothetical protein
MIETLVILADIFTRLELGEIFECIVRGHIRVM